MFKSTTSFFLALFLLGILCVSMNFTTRKKGILSENDDSKRSALVQYGEQIFQRENCLECHTLRDENKSEERISLDGYAGRRSSEWIYMALTKPKAVLSNSQNHSFLLLNKKSIDEASMLEIFRKNGITDQVSIDAAWVDTYNEADTISDFIIEDNETHRKRSELVALIAFLQQIPSTPEKKEQQRLENEWWDFLQKEYEEALANSDSTIRSMTSDPENIQNGKQLFKANCRVCHEEDASGYIGPNLTDNYWIYGNSNSQLFKTIAEGSPTGKMPERRSALNPTEIAQLVTFLNSIKGTNKPGSPPQGDKY